MFNVLSVKKLFKIATIKDTNQSVNKAIIFGKNKTEYIVLKIDLSDDFDENGERSINTIRKTTFKLDEFFEAEAFYYTAFKNWNK